MAYKPCLYMLCYILFSAYYRYFSSLLWLLSIFQSLCGQMIAETVDIEIKRWAAGKEGNMRALLSSLQYVCSCFLLLAV